MIFFWWISSCNRNFWWWFKKQWKSRKSIGDDDEPLTSNLELIIFFLPQIFDYYNHYFDLLMNLFIFADLDGLSMNEWIRFTINDDDDFREELIIDSFHTFLFWQQQNNEKKITYSMLNYNSKSTFIFSFFSSTLL